MTFHEALQKHLIDSGFSEAQARDEIPINGMPSVYQPGLFVCIAMHPSMAFMTGRWLSEISAYPNNFARLIQLQAKPIIYEWIQVHMPLAWFAPVFAPGSEGLCKNDAIAFVEDYFKGLHRMGCEPLTDSFK